MGTEQNTSPGTSATPNPGPATGNNTAPVDATSTKPALSLEEALKRITDLEHSHKNASEEVERHRKKLTSYEKADKEREAAAQAAKDAELSENERTKKQLAEIQAKYDADIKQYRQQLIMSEVKLAAKSMDFYNPDIAAKVIQESLEYGDDGMPTNVQKALEDLAKSNPFLLKPKEEQQNPQNPAQTANNQHPPATPAMNPGRTQISPPGQLLPGQITRLDQVFQRRR